MEYYEERTFHGVSHYRHLVLIWKVSHKKENRMLTVLEHQKEKPTLWHFELEDAS